MYTSLSHCRKNTSDVILVSIKKYYHKVDLGHMYYDSAMEDKDQSLGAKNQTRLQSSLTCWDRDVPGILKQRP